MTRRQLGQVVALLVVPMVCFVVVRTLSGDAYLPVSISYLLLLVMIPYVDLEAFVLLPKLKTLRDRHNELRRIFTFTPAQHSPPSIETSAGVILKDQNIKAAARFEYLLAETARAITAVREEMIKILLINVFLIVFLIILTSNQNAADPGSATSTTTTADSGLTAQTRLALSYVAVVFQLLWMGQVLFHYRQKNVETVTQAGLSDEQREPHLGQPQQSTISPAV